MYIPSKWPLKPKPTHSALGLPVVNAVSIFVACMALEFQVSVLAPEDFSVSNLPVQRLTIRRSCACCSVCMRNGLRFTYSKHCFADDQKTALHEYFGHWWEFQIAFSQMLPRNKNAPWCQTTLRTPLDTSKDESCEFAARWDPHAVPALCKARARQDYKRTSLGASWGTILLYHCLQITKARLGRQCLY